MAESSNILTTTNRTKYGRTDRDRGRAILVDISSPVRDLCWNAIILILSFTLYLCSQVVEEQVVMGFIVMILVIVVNIPRQRNSSSSSRMKSRKKFKKKNAIYYDKTQANTWNVKKNAIYYDKTQTHIILKRTLFIITKHRHIKC